MLAGATEQHKLGHGVHRSRYEVTTSSSETELRTLSELGLAIRVFEAVNEMPPSEHPV